MTYKWLKENVSVQRLADGACIPNDPANTDWREFQKWLAAGNAPLPADQPSPVELIDAQLAEIDRLAGGGRGLREFILVQVQATDALIQQGTLPMSGLLSDNVGIVKLKQLEEQAIALRAQRKAITG